MGRDPRVRFFFGCAVLAACGGRIAELPAGDDVDARVPDESSAPGSVDASDGADAGFRDARVDAPAARDAGGDAEAGARDAGGDGDAGALDAGAGAPCGRSLAWPYLGNMTVDAAGNVILGGQMTAAFDFGGGLLTPPNGYGVFVAEYDDACRFVFAKSWGGTSNHDGADVAVNAAGEIFLTGSMLGTLDFGLGAPLSSTTTNVYLAKLSRSGAPIFARSYGGPAASAIPRWIVPDGSGGLVLAGRYDGTFDAGGGALGPTGKGNVFVMKVDANGAHVWSRGIANASIMSFADMGRAIAVDAAGDVVIGGRLDGATDLGGGALVPTVSSQMFVAKYAGASGARLWSKDAWPSGQVNALAVDAAGDAYVTGTIVPGGDLGFGPVGGVTPVMYLAKLAGSGGAVAWSHAHPSSPLQGSAWPSAVAIDGAGHVVVTGTAYVGAGPSHSFLDTFDGPTGGQLTGVSSVGAMPATLAIGPAGARWLAGTGWGVDWGTGPLSGNIVLVSVP